VAIYVGDQERVAFHARVADSFVLRARGLLGRPAPVLGDGLLITPCRSIHTIGMNYAIDVLFLTKDGVIAKIIPALKPWRAAWGPRGATDVLELVAGAADVLDLRKGMSLDIRGTGRY
jgi:uncharacterized membrane protein (UPF0127 family)